jgi:CRISPR system Cascade subunit CasA
MSEPITSFDLRTQPWILARAHDGEAVELSTMDTFTQAPVLRGLTGDLPTQQLAILRLLLAILLRSLPTGRNSPVDAWQRLWEAGMFPLDRVGAYLEHYSTRFDLLDADTPFYQVANLRTAKDEFFGLERLIADVPTRHQYFTTRAGDAVERISFAEAARWVVHCQAFDPSGIKSGAVGDDRVRGGKGYPIGTAWVGGLGAVVVEGSSLFETLMLNLIPRPPSRDVTSADDRPVWERPAVGPSIEEGHPAPRGPADLFTWQSRRIRLQHDGCSVTGVLIANGDPLEPHDMFNLETMSGWRRSEPQEKKLKRVPVYMPRAHQPERSLWRGFDSLLAVGASPTGGKEAAAFLAPPVLEWIARLRTDGVVATDLPLRTRAISLEYGSQSSVVGGLTDDSVLLHASVLADNELRVSAIDAVRDADQAVYALSQLAGKLVLAAGGEAAGARDRARELGYHALDAPYRRWVSSLVDGVDAYERRADWQRAVRRHIEGLGAEFIENAGDPAWVGRDVNGIWTDTGLSARFFDASLRKHLPLAYPVRGSGEPSRESHPQEVP